MDTPLVQDCHASFHAVRKKFSGYCTTISHHKGSEPTTAILDFVADLDMTVSKPINSIVITGEEQVGLA
nr:hypothetical protein Iba_chr01dCG15880 [Ipomoea batatas]